MIIFDGKVFREMTDSEVAEITKMEEEHIGREKKRPLLMNEVLEMMVQHSINTIPVDDETALRMRRFYPKWESGKAYTEGYKVLFGGYLYRVATAHTSQTDWTPDVAPTLFVRIDETHDGSEFDPIPYNGNMVLENGKHYTQHNNVYVCTRDSVNPVYHNLSDLIGTYVILKED